MFDPTTLSVPAVLLAALAASPHCALMCGPVQVLQLRGGGRRALLGLHLGRLLGYGLLGALAGGLGGLWLRQLPGTGTGLGLQLAAAAGVIAVGVLSLRRPAGGCAHPGRGSAPVGNGRLLARGLAWALLPCGLLYAVLFLALLSGSAVDGALLLLAFGFGSAPLLIVGALAGLRLSPLRRRWSAALLIALGLGSAGAALSGHAGDPAGWCRPPSLVAR